MRCSHCGGPLVLQRDMLWCPCCGHEEPAEGNVLPVSSAPTSWPPHANPKGEYHSKRERTDHDA